jgi:hypothetical protein
MTSDVQNNLNKFEKCTVKNVNFFPKFLNRLFLYTYALLCFYNKIGEM